MKPYSRMTRFALITVCAIIVGVISGCATIPATYTAADIAPEYSEYLILDGRYDPNQKELRRITIKSWGRRIKAAEEAQ